MRTLSDMMVRIRFRGPLASRLVDSIKIEVPEGSILEVVLDKTLEEIPEAKGIWATSEQMDREALLLKNEVDVGLLDGLKTIMENDDEIVVLPLVHGG